MGKEFDAHARGNEVVANYEQQWLDSKWQEFGVYQNTEGGEELAEETLMDISRDIYRRDPKGGNAFDQEKHFENTGVYIIPNLGCDEGK